MNNKRKLSEDYVNNMYLENGDIVKENAISALDEFNITFHVPAQDNEGNSLIALAVYLNDVFWWACADYELLSYGDVKDLYERCFDKDGYFKPYGGTVWGCLKRNMRPQRPLEKRMRANGNWCDELDALPERDDT